MRVNIEDIEPSFLGRLHSEQYHIQAGYTFQLPDQPDAMARDKLGDTLYDDDGLLSKTSKILFRRQDENLPFFGRIVEYADQTQLRYHEYQDTRNIELFFDLFFVAIFSTFTKNHEINSNESLSSYAIYFGVIWASWLQICLYDVRFGIDSIWERGCKVMQMVRNPTSLTYQVNRSYLR
jgi:hypothetical protein